MKKIIVLSKIAFRNVFRNHPIVRQRGLKADIGGRFQPIGNQEVSGNCFPIGQGKGIESPA